MEITEDPREVEIYATVPMKFGEVRLYSRLDDVVARISESSEDNIIAYQGARIKYLQGLLKSKEQIETA